MNDQRICTAKRSSAWLTAGLATAMLILSAPRPTFATLIAPLDAPQSLNAPQAVKGTFAVGVSGDNIVGGYYSATAASHGFLYNGASFIPLDFPGSATTTTLGISGNEIVGFYTDGAAATHGFLYDGANWSSLDDPAGNHTVANGISGGNIVGYFSGASGINGFLYNGGQWTTLADPAPARC